MTNQKNTNSIIRQKEKQKIIEALIKNQNNTLNINGKWGCGKTYLSKLVQNDLNQDQRRMIALRVNISDYSYVNDPLVLFIITILDYINANDDVNVKKELLKSISKVVNIIAFASLLLDQSGTIKNVIDSIKGGLSQEKKGATPKNQLESSLANIKSYQKAIDELNSSIKLICEKLEKEKIIIFVDDFDRVNPEFAFKVLNIIHQLREKIDKLQICTVMNRKQFETQLCHLYGRNDNDEHYLTKYIDLEITVTNPVLSYPQEFLKEFAFSAQSDQFKFLRGWLSLLSIREVQVFSKSFRDKLLEMFDNGYDLNRILQVDNFAAYYLVLLYIILVRFDLDFRSFEANLLNLEDCNVLAGKLQTFYSKIIDKKHYENYISMESGTENSGNLGAISDITFSFLLTEIKGGDSFVRVGLDSGFIEKFKVIKGIINKAYKEYFKLDN